jgi:protein-L-isoaspartate(D-aspartate) O-methyltransferase
MKKPSKGDFQQARLNMVLQQVEPFGVSDTRILDSLSRLPREHFVADSVCGVAYADSCLPIGCGEMSLPPKVIGMALQALQLESNHTVLEIGTGTGYITALLASLVQQVVSIEILPELAQSASRILPHFDFGNITIHVGNGLLGAPSTEGPFDVIMLSGSVPYLPTVLRDQLSIHGRLFAVIGEPPVMSAVLLTRVASEYWTEQVLFETGIPSLQKIPCMIDQFDW